MRILWHVLLSIPLLTWPSLAQELPKPPESPSSQPSEKSSQLAPPDSRPATPSPSAQPSGHPYTIGVVEDGTCLYFEELLAQVEKELKVLMGKDRDVVFKKSREFNTGWNMDQAASALENALKDPSVDLVFAAGILAAQQAAKPGVVLTKPVISGFVQDPDSVGLPYDQDGHSTKKNYNFVIVPLRSSRDLEVLYSLAPFKRLGILADSKLIGQLEGMEKAIQASEQQFQAKLILIPVDLSAEEALKSLPEKLDAIYLTPAMRMQPDEWVRLIQGLNERKLPTLSLMGHADVMLGALAGLMPDANERLARRLALNIQQIMQDVAPESLQVPMNVDESLFINAKTAADIGFSPPFQVMLQAQFLHEEALLQGARLNLEQAVRIALENNLDLSIKAAEVRGVRHDRNLALSTLFPQVDGNVTYSRIDSDRAETSGGAQPEEKTAAGISATQILFNDPALSSYRAQKRVYAGWLFDQDNTRLDVIESAARSYIQFLQAGALVSIDADNMALIRSNLELARIRHQVGTAGPEEVYRWETQMASSKASLLKAMSALANAQLELNRVMGIDLGKQWVPMDIQKAGDDYFFLGGRLRDYIKNDAQFRVFRRYATDFALRESPLLKSLDEDIAAQRIFLDQYKRRFVVPEFAANFTLDHKLNETFAGEPSPSPAGPTADDNEWLAGLQASIPLFKSGRRVFDVARAQARLDQLTESKKKAAQLVEQKVHAVLSSIESSFPNMSLQQSAADFAQKNLDVIKDKYARGVVSILDLLDAQNQFFVAQQNAAIAVYSFLSDLVDLQRSVSWFESVKTESEKDTFVKGYQQYLTEYVP
ncbi:MAG: TolC family protein [Lentisphaerota bacterium]